MNLCIAAHVTLDLFRLVDNRMLVQASSGGGKSWLLRLLAEQAAGKAQVLRASLPLCGKSSTSCWSA